MSYAVTKAMWQRPWACWATSRPDSSGISMSRNRMSGVCRSIKSSASTPVAASPTMRSAGHSSRRCWRNSSRRTVSSSANMADGDGIGSCLTGLELDDETPHVAPADILDAVCLRFAPEHRAPRDVVLLDGFSVGGFDAHRPARHNHRQMRRMRVHPVYADAHSGAVVVVAHPQFVVFKGDA